MKMKMVNVWGTGVSLSDAFKCHIQDIDENGNTLISKWVFQLSKSLELMSSALRFKYEEIFSYIGIY